MPTVGDKIRLEIDRKLMNVGLVGDYNGLPIRITEREIDGEVGDEVLVRIREHKGGYARGIILEKYTSSQSSPSELSGSQEIESDVNSGSQTAKTGTSEDQSEESEEDVSGVGNTGSKQYTETTTQTLDTELDIDQLRKKAEDSAVEEVPEDVSTTTTEKPQYNRSTEVKEYVKARADGVCEGCGEPAPFTNKAGEPYLHAHHIHELSDGGSDTPETVVALCPNCHYRVHHGKDGDDYNQELLEIVQEKESANDS